MKKCSACHEKFPDDEGRIDDDGKFLCTDCDQTGAGDGDSECPECGEVSEEFRTEKVCPQCGAEAETDDDEEDDDKADDKEDDKEDAAEDKDEDDEGKAKKKK